MQQLLERIQKDATSTIKRWSMRELASQHLRCHPKPPPLQPQPPPLSSFKSEDATALNPSHNNSTDNYTSTNTDNIVDSNNNDRNFSTELLQCTVQRLAVQHESLRAWKLAVNETLHRQQQQQLSPKSVMTSFPSTARTTATNSTAYNDNSNILQLYNSVIKRIDTLQYIHYDTYRIGQQILHHPSQILVRQSPPDQHVIHTTFLEIRARHAKTIETIVDIVSDLRRQPPQPPSDSIDESSTEFSFNNHDQNEKMAEQLLRRRIGIQLLCDHHVALHKGKVHGGISVQARLLEHVLSDAIQEAKHIVDAHLPIVPEVIVEMVVDNHDDTTNIQYHNRSHDPTHPEIHCTMIQPWVHHAIVELLKNAMSSTVRQMQYMNHTMTSSSSSTTTPTPTPVYITCCDKKDSVTIDIIDAGTGIVVGNNDNDNTAAIQQAFMLGHTTASIHRYDRLNEQQSYASVQIPPLSSLGVGLPLSRYFMEHFHGTLQLWNNNNHPNPSTTTVTTSTTGCTARIELWKDDTILERSTPW